MTGCFAPVVDRFPGRQPHSVARLRVERLYGADRIEKCCIESVGAGALGAAHCIQPGEYVFLQNSNRIVTKRLVKSREGLACIERPRGSGCISA